MLTDDEDTLVDKCGKRVAEAGRKVSLEYQGTIENLPALEDEVRLSEFLGDFESDFLLDELGGIIGGGGGYPYPP
jgi:hypothetical protein